MSSEHTLVLTQPQIEELKNHLFPNEGFEAASILICGRAGTTQYRKYCVRKIVNVPYAECKVKTKNRITWPGKYLEKSYDFSNDEHDSIFLIHSHPNGLYGLSDIDYESNQGTIPSIYCALGTGPHGSAVMTPDDKIYSVVYYDKFAKSDPIQMKVVLVSDDISELSPEGKKSKFAYSSNMRKCLLKQAACVVGVSGTGSIVAEQLARLGIGRLILVDYDKVEFKNINRILNSTITDAESNVSKVRMMANVINSYRDDIEIIEIDQPINNLDVIEHASSADVLFSCVDNISARDYCDIVCQCTLTPLIDLGVSISPRTVENGEIHVNDICGRVDFIKPGGSTLWDRGIITQNKLHSEELKKNSPEAAEEQIKRGYIQGIAETAPDVISLNMYTASKAINEYLARMFNYRIDGSDSFASIRFSLVDMAEDYKSESEFKPSQNDNLGKGVKYISELVPSLKSN